MGLQQRLLVAGTTSSLCSRKDLTEVLFKKNKLFIHLFIFCCDGSSVLHADSLVALHGLLIAVATFVAEHGLQGPGASVVMAPGLYRAQAQ